VPTLSKNPSVLTWRRPCDQGQPRRYKSRRCASDLEVEIVDQWYGPDYCYFKVKGNDGGLYILRFDKGCAEWALTMFQSPVGSNAARCMLKGQRI